jgi:hypothetical protein
MRVSEVVDVPVIFVAVPLATPNVTTIKLTEPI